MIEVQQFFKALVIFDMSYHYINIYCICSIANNCIFLLLFEHFHQITRLNFPSDATKGVHFRGFPLVIVILQKQGISSFSVVFML